MVETKCKIKILLIIVMIVYLEDDSLLYTLGNVLRWINAESTCFKISRIGVSINCLSLLEGDRNRLD